MRRDGPGARLLPPLPGLTRPAAAIPSDKSLGYCRSSLPGLKTKSGPVSFAAKQKPHRPSNATALGLRAGDVPRSCNVDRLPSKALAAAPGEIAL